MSPENAITIIFAYQVDDRGVTYGGLETNVIILLSQL